MIVLSLTGIIVMAFIIVHLSCICEKVPTVSDLYYLNLSSTRSFYVQFMTQRKVRFEIEKKITIKCIK